MYITREGIIDHWLSEPKIEPPAPKGMIRLGWRVYFPELNTLSAQEKGKLRPLLKKHPEWLEHEIDVDSKFIN
jgi:hypothetical protein